MRAYVVNPSLYDFLRAHTSILDEIAGLDPKGEWIVRMDAETLHTAASCYFGTPVHRAGDTLQLRRNRSYCACMRRFWSWRGTNATLSSNGSSAAFAA